MKLHTEKPTIFSFEDLYTWVIWQFPLSKGDHLCGAVRPPTGESGWYAALIDTDNECLQLFGHIKQTFDTPEAAADYLHNGQHSNQ